MASEAYVAIDAQGRPFAVFDDELVARQHTEEVAESEGIELQPASIIVLPRYPGVTGPRGQWLWTLSGRVLPEGDGHKVVTDQRMWARTHWEYEPGGLWQLVGCRVERGEPRPMMSWLQVTGHDPEAVRQTFDEEAAQLAQRMKALDRAS